MCDTNENSADTIKVNCSGIFFNGEKYYKNTVGKTYLVL